MVSCMESSSKNKDTLTYSFIGSSPVVPLSTTRGQQQPAFRQPQVTRAGSLGRGPSCGAQISLVAICCPHAQSRAISAKGHSCLQAGVGGRGLDWRRFLGLHSAGDSGQREGS